MRFPRNSRATTEGRGSDFIFPVGRPPPPVTLLVGLSLFCAVVAAQPAKNLKVLTPDTDLTDTMKAFNEALGVQCDYCHVAGDFASDANPRKETSRKMIAMVRQIESYFPTTNGVFPRG